MEGKVAIVTGGGGGLGSEICRRFASRGAAVAVVDMNADTAGACSRRHKPPAAAGRWP